MTSVSAILPADRHRAMSTLSLAFANDPFVRWFGVPGGDGPAQP